jgi:hypothetical protein
MRALFLILSLIGLCGCVKTNTAPGFEYEVRTVDQGQTMKGRFYFIHGMGQTISDLKTGQWARMGDFMHAQNFEVVYIGWPFMYGNSMTHEGSDYVAYFQDWIWHLDQQLVSERPATQTLFGGSSMGGWHSILASEVIHTDAVYAIEPVVHLEILWPFANCDASDADLTGPDRKLPSNLFITVGLDDTSVGWWYQRDLFQALPNYHEFANEIHAPYEDQFDATMAWLTQQIK